MNDWSPWFRLTLSVLATWRVSHLIASEDGPFDVIVRLRQRAGDGVLGKLMDCPYCLSLWIAAPLALLLADGAVAWCVAWLAISGGALLLEKLSRSATPRNPAAEPMIFPLPGDYDDVMLRTETRDAVDPDRPVPSTHAGPRA
ncbi:MAG TPA: DUF1360 domain-containing protein [Thermoanaerobaculia bacterium]